VRPGRIETAHRDAVSLADSDLGAYLERIGHSQAVLPDPASLQALHLAHATHIPFENLDVLLQRPILIDLASLADKLVARKRGGYCFEQNLLFAAVLQRLGFALTPLAARVRYRAHTVLPRTHMLLLVHFDGGDWIADVGFGGEGLLLPIPLREGVETHHYAWTYRVTKESGRKGSGPQESGLWLLQSRHDDAWTDLYAFTTERQHPADYEMANYYMSTHPNSRFVQTLTVQLPGTEVRHVLRNLELTEDRGTHSGSRTLSGEDERLQVLADVFGLHFPDGTRFRVPHPAAPA
jgi:N-hydroxyarylamine O-acetyltransferase